MRRLPGYLLLLSLLLVGCQQDSDILLDAAVEQQISALQTPIPVEDWHAQVQRELAAHFAQFQLALQELSRDNNHGETLEQLQHALSHWHEGFNQHYLLLATYACATSQYRLLARSDSWPLYAGYLDSLPEWPQSGLINDTSIDITPATLRRQHQTTDHHEVSLGFSAMHTIADRYAQPGDDASSVTVEDDPENPALNLEQQQQRRLQFLSAASQQLQDDLSSLTAFIALTRQHMDCGLRLTLERESAFEAWREAPSEYLYVPAATIDAVAQSTLRALQHVPDVAMHAWSDQRSILNAALDAAQDGDIQPLKALHAIQPTHRSDNLDAP